MANYLTRSDGKRPEAKNITGSKNDLHTDPMYKARLFNADRTIMLEGRLPEDFSLSLAGSWGAGLESLFMSAFRGLTGGGGADLIEKVAKATGITTRNYLGTVKTWEQPSYISTSIPISLYAYDDTQKEVIERLQQMLQLGAPKVSDAGVLSTPGPVPSKILLEQITGGQETGTFLDKMVGEIMTLQIGTFFTMTPVVVQNVSANFDALMEHGTGNPISVQCLIQVESALAVTQADVLAWLHGNA